MNIPDHLSQKALAEAHDPKPTSFVPQKEAIYNLMKFDSYSRFANLQFRVFERKIVFLLNQPLFAKVIANHSDVDLIASFALVEFDFCRADIAKGSLMPFLA